MPKPQKIIRLANFPKGDLRETNSISRPLNLPDPSTWTEQKIAKIDFQNMTSGLVTLCGKWTDAYFDDKYWLLEELEPLDFERKVILYAIHYEVWKNVLPKIKAISGTLGRTNNKKVLLENIDLVEPQSEIADENFYFDIQAESSDPKTDDLIPLEGTKEPSLPVTNLFSGKDDYKYLLPVDLSKENWKDSWSALGSNILFWKVKSWKTDLIKEIKDYFSNTELNLGPANKLSDVNLSALFAEFSQKSFFVLYKKGAVRITGDTSSAFSLDLSKAFNITDITPISNLNATGYKSVIEIANKYFDSAKRWDIFHEIDDEFKGDAHGITYLKTAEKIDLILAKGKAEIRDFYTPGVRIISSREINNQNVEKFIENWKSLCRQANEVNCWWMLDIYRRRSSYKSLNEFVWPKDDNDFYIKPERVSWRTDKGSVTTIGLHFPGDLGTPHLWYPNIDTLIWNTATNEDIKKFQETYKDRWVYTTYSGKWTDYLPGGLQLPVYYIQVPRFKSQEIAQKEVFSLFETKAVTLQDYEKIFKTKETWPTFEHDENGELEKLLAAGIELLNDDFSLIKRENGDPRIFWPNLGDGHIYAFKLEGTPFCLIYKKSGQVKHLELLLLDESLLRKNTYSNFSVLGGGNTSLSIIQRINQRNSLFCFGETIPFKQKLFSEKNPETIPLPGLSIYYLNSDFQSPYDNYEVSYKSSVETVSQGVKRLKAQELTQVYNMEALSGLRLQQKYMKEEARYKKELALQRVKMRKSALSGAKNSFLLDAAYSSSYVTQSIANAGTNIASSLIAGKIFGGPLGLIGGISSAGNQVYDIFRQNQINSRKLALKSAALEKKTKSLETNMKIRTANVYLETRRAEEELLLGLSEQFNKFEVPDFDDIEALNHYLARINKKPIHWVLSVPNQGICEQYLEPMLSKFGTECFISEFTLFPGTEGLYEFSDIDHIELNKDSKLDLYEQDALIQFLLNGINLVTYDWENEEIISDDKFWEKPLLLKQLEFEIAKTNEEATAQIQAKLEDLKKKETTFIEVTKEQEAKLKELRDNFDEIQRNLTEKDKKIEQLTLEKEANEKEIARLNELSVQESGQISDLNTENTRLQESNKFLTLTVNAKEEALKSQKALNNTLQNENAQIGQEVTQIREKLWDYWRMLKVISNLFFESSRPSESGTKTSRANILAQVYKAGEDYDYLSSPLFISRIQFRNINKKIYLDFYILARMALYPKSTSAWASITSTRFINNETPHLNIPLRVTIPEAEWKNADALKTAWTKTFTTNNNQSLGTPSLNSIKSMDFDWENPWGKKISDFIKSSQDYYADQRNDFNDGKEWYES